MSSVLLGSLASLAIGMGPACLGDLNQDGIIDGADLTMLLSAWGSCSSEHCPEDLATDGVIDGQDLSVLLGSWGDLDDACQAGPSSERHEKWPIGTRYEEQGFWEYLPHRYEQENGWPLLVFLHGLGENGDGSSNQLDRVPSHGPARLIAEDRWPVAESQVGDRFVILSPQNSRNNCHHPNDIDAFLRWAIQNYDVDPTRVYLTGLSCGAIGSWDYLNDHLADDLLAAVIPICGYGVSAWNTHECQLASLPIWGFHGNADDVVNSIGTIYPISNMQLCTNPDAIDARMTIYEGVGHDSWSRTYDLEAGHDIYAWLLSHSNSDAGP